MDEKYNLLDAGSPVTNGVAGVTSGQIFPRLDPPKSEPRPEDNPNVFWVGQAGFEADNDRVIVLQDVYRSGFECQTCFDENKHRLNGREVSTVACIECKGIGNRPKSGNPTVQVKCSECSGKGWVICPECAGKGGTLVLADNQKGRPTTGEIVSIGPLVKNRELGQKVMYPGFSGHAYDLKGVGKDGRLHEVILVVLRDEDIISRMYGTLEQNNVKGSQARYTNA